MNTRRFDAWLGLAACYAIAATGICVALSAAGVVSGRLVQTAAAATTFSIIVALVARLASHRLRREPARWAALGFLTMMPLAWLLFGPVQQRDPAWSMRIIGGAVLSATGALAALAFLRVARRRCQSVVIAPSAFSTGPGWRPDPQALSHLLEMRTHFDRGEFDDALVHYKATGRDSPLLDELHRRIVACDLLLTYDFDWLEWGKQGGVRYFRSHDEIGRAKWHALRCCLTAIVRQDRFHGGFYASTCVDGMMRALLERVEQLAVEETRSSAR